jgi:hypothetical protein
MIGLHKDTAHPARRPETAVVVTSWLSRAAARASPLGVSADGLDRCGVLTADAPAVRGEGVEDLIRSTDRSRAPGRPSWPSARMRRTAALCAHAAGRSVTLRNGREHLAGSHRTAWWASSRIAAPLVCRASRCAGDGAGHRRGRCWAARRLMLRKTIAPGRGFRFRDPGPVGSRSARRGRVVARRIKDLN